MKLPKAGEVLIEDRKVEDYLLSRSHPVGRFKARVFAALGFDGMAVTAFIGELGASRRMARCPRWSKRRSARNSLSPAT